MKRDESDVGCTVVRFEDDGPGYASAVVETIEEARVEARKNVGETGNPSQIWARVKLNNGKIVEVLGEVVCPEDIVA